MPSDLAKTILQYTVKGKRRGRQKKSREGNIKGLTEIDFDHSFSSYFASSIRAAENRIRWKGIVANSSLVPRRPSKVMEKNRNRNRIDRKWHEHGWSLKFQHMSKNAVSLVNNPVMVDSFA